MRFLMLNWRDPQNPLAGGAERVSVAYMAELARRGHEVFWFANHFPGARQNEQVRGISFFRGGGKGTSIWRAIEWCRGQAPFDLIIDQHHGLPWYAPWWSRTNCVAYIHEVLGPIWRNFYRWPLSTLGQMQEAWTLRRYRQVPFWTPSDSTRKLLIAHGVQKVKVIPNGCDAQPLASLDAKPLELPLRLITVSRLAPNKRVDHAIRAAKVLRSRGIEVQLTIVGRGDSEPLLSRMVGEMGLRDSVSFAGGLTEDLKNEYLRRAHWLIHTSVREGWGLNVIEANAMGTPAIVYPVEGLVDSTVDGVTGRIVTTESPEALAEGLLNSLANKETYASLRENAWRRSFEFMWERVLPEAANWLESNATRASG